MLFYIQSAFEISTAEKHEQEKKSLVNLTDGFKRIIVVKDVVEYYGQKKPLVLNGGNCNTDFKETILIVLILCSIQNVGTARDS